MKNSIDIIMSENSKIEIQLEIERRWLENLKIKCWSANFKSLNAWIRYEVATDFEDFEFRVGL